MSVSVTESARSDLDSKNHATHHSRQSMISSELSTDQDDDETLTLTSRLTLITTTSQPQQQQQQQQVQARPKLKTSLRIRVINESSQRSKDLVVDVSSSGAAATTTTTNSSHEKSVSLYQAVYNNPAVKAAHVRKWPAEIVTRVNKEHTSVIQMAVWDEELDKPHHIFSLEDLKTTTPFQLLELVGPETDLIKLVLQCVKVVDQQPQQQHTIPAAAAAAVAVHQNPNVRDGTDNSTSIIDPTTTTTATPTTTATITATTTKQAPPGEKITIQAPSSCPFSGVAVDPALWESFQAKLANNSSQQNQPHQHHQSLSQSRRDESTRSTEDLPKVLDQLSSSAKSQVTTFRVRVMNDTTQRTKDLVVDVSGESLWDRVYNHASVQEAHVRKWGSPIAQKVKRGLAEIKVTLSWGDDNNNNNNKAWYTPPDLQSITTHQLYYDMIPREERTDLLVTFHLVCVPINNKNTDTTTATTKKHITTNSPTTPQPGFSRSNTGASASSRGTGSLLGFRRSNTLTSTSSNNNTYSSGYSSGMDESSMMLSAVRHEVLVTSSSNYDSFAEDENSDCNNNNNNTKLLSIGPSSGLDSASLTSQGFLGLSMMMDSSQQQSHHLGSWQEKTTLGVRVINQVTDRFKDVVVDISDTTTIYDAVYNHPGVKEAHVRKWDSEIARKVKAGASEIKFLVWDDDSGKPWHEFSLEDLKKTSTRQLSESVAEHSNLVKIYLQCCDVENAATRQENNAVEAELILDIPKSHSPPPQASLRLENGRPQYCSTPSLRHSRSEANLLSESIPKTPPKKPHRANHMHISVPSPASPLRSVTFHSSPSDEGRLKHCQSAGALKSLGSASYHSTPKVSTGSLRLLGVKERLKKKNLLTSYSNTDLRGSKPSFGAGFRRQAAAAAQSPIGGQNATWRSVGTRLSSTTTVKMPPRASSIDTTSSNAESADAQAGSIREQVPLTRRFSDSSMADSTPRANQQKSDKMLKELMRLLRKKQPAPDQTRRSLQSAKERETDIDSSFNDSFTESNHATLQESLHMSFHEGSNLAFRGTSDAHFHVSVPAVVRAQQERRDSLTSKVSVLTYQEKRPSMGTPLESPRIFPSPKTTPLVQKPFGGTDICRNNLPVINAGVTGNAKTNDKILRFLTPQNPNPANRGTFNVSCSNSRSISESSGTSSKKDSDAPPITEISISNDGTGAKPAGFQAPMGVSLSPEVVKEVFPYHIVLDADFRIIQVGNSFGMLIQEASVIGRLVSDILMVTSPIPIFGNWDWSILSKMKDKTIFLETVLSPEKEDKVKVKGTIIDVSGSSKRVMLALFPNVKNLAELEDSNLSMVDLPLHSCQREAVLLGEHSKSEVRLTNHLDKLHRDLIDSMEQQIKDRTEELGKANNDLEKANEQLAVQSARQLEHFACMSHEIRTPLNCIVGMSSLLLDDADELDPLHADSIRMINTSGDLLRAVVDDVLDYAKLESGSFEVDIKETILQHTLESITHSISQKIMEKNCTLRTFYDPFLPEIIEVDYRRLQQILFNLLGNAGKFSKTNSVVDLTVRVVPVSQTKVNPSETTNGECIRFSVKDYGKGIEEKDFQSIFQPFSQASKETQTVYGGTGLGLSITSKLVHRLGGTISLKSEYGKYAEFTVDLPFRGKLVNTAELSQRLSDVAIVLVHPKKPYAYRQPLSVLGPDPTPFGHKMIETLGLGLSKFSTLNDAYSGFRNGNITVGGKKCLVILVHEDLYQAGLFERFQKCCRIDVKLMTYGPNYSIETTKDKHFKSLEGIFPSSLMAKIADTVGGQEKLTLSKDHDAILSPPGQTSGLFSLSPAVKLPESNLVPSGGLLAGLSKTAQSQGGPVGMTNEVQESFKASPQALVGSASGCLFAGKSNSTPAQGVPPEKTLKRLAPGIPPSTPLLSTATTNLKTGEDNKKNISPRNVKILYAEDNLVNQKVLSRVLVRSGISDITIVDNGKKAVDTCDSTKFDIIFMDVQMPIMGGLEATKIIVDRDPTAKVVFVTAHALDEFKSQAEAAGATNFISKPFRLDDIKTVLCHLGF